MKSLDSFSLNMGLHMFPHLGEFIFVLMPKESRYPQGSCESTFFVKNRTNLRIITKEKCVLMYTVSWKDNDSSP